ncbi:hypothetical protein IAT38_006483 [Cryptococcus sp. DSM 104549]
MSHPKTTLASGAALLTLLALGSITLLPSPLSTYLVDPRQLTFPQLLTSSSSPSCPQPEYTPPFKNSSYFDTEEFGKLALERLTRAITYRTISYDDFGEPEPKEGEPRDDRWDVFAEFYEFLKKTYPLTFSSAKVELSGGYSLVITMEGSTDAKPIMLTGHQDVVGIGSERDWEYPPFEGYYDGEYIWGRGSSDCKSNVMGLLSVFERLTENGFQPKRTVILAFGQDEEASGRFGAGRIGEKLLERYGKDGIELILDEGGLGLDTVYGPLMALPALSEKGYADVAITVTSKAGHSSVPPKHTAIGYLTHIAAALEDEDLFKPVLESNNPHYQYLQCVVEHGKKDLVPSWLSRALKKKDLNRVAKGMAETAGDGERYLMQTTKAITKFGGGIKNNVLPDEATMNINSRLEISSSVADHLEIIRKAFIPLAKSYNLTLVFLNSTLHTGSSDTLIVTLSESSEPAPATSWTSDQWAVMSSAIRATFGEYTVASPSLSTSNTDTRNYWDISSNIFRWTPARTGTRLNAHGANERIMLKTHMEAVKFYHELILRMDATA